MRVTSMPAAPARHHASLHQRSVAPPPSLVTAWPRVSIVVPTYREAENLPTLIDRIDRMRRENAIDLELVIVDDDSGDGTAELLASTPQQWVRLFTRKHDFGLSAAVLDGLKQSTGDAIVVMDADLSHPPEAVPVLIAELLNGHDFVIGSRYVQGGTTDDQWGVWRWLNSKFATWLARPFTAAGDPMAGYFALWRTAYIHADPLNPIGYKIGLELLVKTRAKHIKEVPIHFADRQKGQSKLNLREQLRYIQHIKRLFDYKFGNWSCLAQFLIVGATGTGVNLLVLTLLLAASVPVTAALAMGIIVAMHWNFHLNRRLSFAYARHQAIVPRYFGFVASCSIGAAVNYVTALSLLVMTGHTLPAQLAAIIGIVAGTAINFTLNRFIVFRKPASLHATGSLTHGNTAS